MEIFDENARRMRELRGGRGYLLSGVYGGGGVNAGVPMTVGRWYPQWATGGMAQNVAGFNSNRMFAVPMLFGKACTINGVAINVKIVGEAGSKCRLGIYDDADGMPGNLVADWGQVAGDAVAIPTLTPSTVVQASWYWTAIAFQAAPTTRPTISSLQQLSYAHRVADVNPGVTAAANCYLKEGVTGALPASFGAPDGYQGIPICPAIWLKAA